MAYRIDIDGIKSDFKFKAKGSFSFSTGTINSRLPLLPYSTHIKEIEIKRVTGAFSRLMNRINTDTELDISDLPQTITKKVMIESNEERSLFMHFIRDTFFLESDNILFFHPQILNYSNVGDKEHKKIGCFLYSVLYDDSIKKEISDLYNKKVNNILFQLILESMPSNQDCADMICPSYFNYVPYVKQVFLEDLQFLSGKFDLYLNNIDKLIKYYYFFYVSQITLKLDKMFDADLTRPEILFFNLADEKISSYRESYKRNWNLLTRKSDNLFYHVILLEILNHNFTDEKVSYTSLKHIYASLNDDEKLLFSEDISNFIDDYKNQKDDLNWSNFKFDYAGNEIGFEMIDHLYNAIVYSFEYGGRKGADSKYSKNFTRYCEKYFLKTHGRSGKVLTIWQDMLVFITQLCIRDNEKISLKNLFIQYERRGLSFDYETKKSVIQMFERLNLLEKKSDSGDAQYVKAIL